MFYKFTLIYIILLFLFVGSAFGEIRRVPSEYQTIQDALYDCNDGDTVLVAPGIYYGVISIMKSVTVKSERGYLTCINIGGGIGFSTNNTNATLDGFTLINGSIGIGDHSHANIYNCIITGNNAFPSIKGGGLYILGSANITNCLITGNMCSGYHGVSSYYKSYGGGVFCSSTGTSVFRNCTISGNKADIGGGIAWTGSGTLTFENCIISGNIANFSSGSQVYAGCAGRSIPAGGAPPIGNIMFTSCFFDNDPNAFYYEKPFPSAPDEIFYLDKCIVGNPEFANPGYWDPNETPDDQNDDYWIDGDYHLKSKAGRWDPNTQTWVQDDVTSPCIDAGDPNSPIGLEPFPNGGYINMGVYGGTSEASKSYFGKPVCETIVAGDINGDCKVDILDLEILMFHWLEDKNLY